MDLTSKATPVAAAWRATLVFVGLITAVRLVGLFLSPIELYPEEAQYWLWSRTLDFGYFSKPPMVAWAIWATTRFSDAEPFVRLAAPLAHGAAALMLARAGRRLYGGWTPFWGAVLYSLAPGVQLSAAVIATDSLMLAAAALVVWAYAAWLTSEDARGRLGWAAAMGLGIGLGALSKYAILYVALGLVLHAALSRATRRRWRPAEVALTVGVALLALSPNLAWNAAHGFQTVAHTAHDADWRARPAHGGAEAEAGPDQKAGHGHVDLLNARTAPGFLLSQLGVFGPVPFLVLVGGGAWLLVRRRSLPADRALGALAAPALVLILGESLVARANANWAAAAYAPASLLVAAWLLRWQARAWIAVAATTGAVVLAAFLALAVSPALANRLGAANSFKRARGWAAVDALVVDEARKLGPSSLSAITVDDRFTFNALRYYGRANWPAGAPPLTVWQREIRPGNEAETTSSLSDGRRVLFVDIGGAYRAEAMRDFAHVRPLGAWRVWTDPRHFRSVYLFLGEGYHRRPRNPKTGLPIPA